MLPAPATGKFSHGNREPERDSIKEALLASGLASKDVLKALGV